MARLVNIGHTQLHTVPKWLIQAKLTCKSSNSGTSTSAVCRTAMLGRARVESEGQHYLDAFFAPSLGWLWKSASTETAPGWVSFAPASRVAPEIRGLHTHFLQCSLYTDTAMCSIQYTTCRPLRSAIPHSQPSVRWCGWTNRTFVVGAVRNVPGSSTLPTRLRAGITRR